MRFLAFLFILIVLGLGYGVMLLRRNRWVQSRELIETYRKRFRSFCFEYQETFNQDHYEWLMRGVLRVQAAVDELMESSRYADYFQRDYGRSDRSLVEILEQMSQTTVHEQRLSAANNLLTRCLGIADEEVEKAEKNRLNPLVLFREGIRSILLIPTLIGRWASGRSQLERLIEPDDRRIAGWVSTWAVLGLLIPVIVLMIGWAPIADSTAYLIRQWLALVSQGADWVAESISMSLLIKPSAQDKNPCFARDADTGARGAHPHEDKVAACRAVGRFLPNILRISPNRSVERFVRL